MTDLTLDQATRQKIDMPKTWTGEFKALMFLGIPMAFTQLAQFLIFTIDIVMIGRYGADILPAAALGTVIYFMLWMLGFGPVMAVSPMISQALGADQDDKADARVSVRMALWTIAMLTPIILCIVLRTEQILLLFGQDPVQSARAAKYTLALIAGWPFAMGTMVLRNFLAAIGKTSVPFALIMVTLAINAGLNALLIFGYLGFPEMGLVGAGIASSLSYSIGFVFFIAYIAWDKRAAGFEIFGNFFHPHWHRLGEILRLGWPISVTTMFEGMLFNACVFLVGLIGTIEVAAYQIALNVASLAFMLPFGFSMAGSVRVGLAKGADNALAVRRAALVTIATSVAVIMCFAIPIALLPEKIAGLYLNTNNPDNAMVLALVAGFLPLASGFMFFDAVQVAANQVVRGLKDVKWPMIYTGISYWLIGFPTAAWLSQKTSVGADGVWYGLMAGLITASIFLSARLWYLAWRKASAINSISAAAGDGQELRE